MTTVAACRNCNSPVHTQTFCPQCGFDFIADRHDPELFQSLQRDWLGELKAESRQVVLNVIVQSAREQKENIWKNKFAYAIRSHQITEAEVETALQIEDALDFRSNFELALEQLFLGDYKKAMLLALKSGGEGDPKGQCLLGSAFLDWAISRDTEEAISWLTKSAAQDFAPAQHQLGNLYFEGTFVSPNSALAKDWFLKAARQGYPYAEFGLGILSSESNDMKQTLIWMERSAARGFCLAQFHLGCSYEDGQFSERNVTQAEYWLRKAADQDLSYAKDRLEQLRKGNR